MFVVLVKLAGHGVSARTMSWATEGFSAITSVLALVLLFICLQFRLSRAHASAYGRAHARPWVHVTKKSPWSKKSASPATPNAPNPRQAHPGTRRSGVHGKGVFAVQDIAEGETLIEYVGEIISWQEAQDRHPHDPADPNHTFYFSLEDGRVIDAKHGATPHAGSIHSCDGNCETDEVDGRVFIKALRNIAAGEELSYDYGLIIDERYTKTQGRVPVLVWYPGVPGHLLSPKPRRSDERRAAEGAKAPAGSVGASFCRRSHLGSGSAPAAGL